MRGRKTGGRQAGTPNKATSTIVELVEAEAGAPLPVLLTRIGMKAMKDGEHQTAVNAFSKAAAYVYPRITTVPPPSPPIPAPIITFMPPREPEPCSSCGHDPSKDIHITRRIIHDGPSG